MAGEASIEDRVEHIGIGEVLRGTCDLVRRRPMGLVLGAGGLAVGESLLDLASSETDLSFIGSVASIGVVYAIFRVLLEKEGLIEREGKFSSYLGVSLLAGLASAIGFVFFIVPGLFLMARWSLASAMVVTKGLRATAAMKASWGATSAIAWKLVLLFVVCLAGYLVVFSVLGFLGVTAATLANGGSADGYDRTPVFILTSNLLVSIGTVGATYLSVALFRNVAAGSRELEQVFA